MRKRLKGLFLVLFLLLNWTFSLYSKNISINLSEKEKKWLAAHPIINVANETDWPPFDFNENDKPKGLSIDYIKLLAKKIGIKLNFIHGYNWSELIELFKKGKIDVMPVFYVNDDRKKFTIYTSSYHRAKLGVFTYNEYKNWDSSLHNKRVGIEKSHGSIPFIKKQYPKIKLIQFNTKQELVRKLGTKKLDAIIGNPFVFYYHARESQINNIYLTDFIKMNREQQKKTSFHIGVRKDWPLLLRILQKGMHLISDKELDEIKNKWTKIYIIKKIDWKLIIQISSIILLIIAFLLYHNLKLKSVVKIKTLSLKKLNENLELKVKQRTNELSKLNKELNKLNYSKNKFFSIVSHDLRAPLSSILAISKLASQKDYNLKYEELIKLIHKSASVTYSLLENLLTWSESESGQMKISPVEIKLSDFINEIVTGIQTIASHKKIEIKQNIEKNLVAFADYNMANTILRNLLTNAVKFTHESGLISVNTVKNYDMVEISVKDNGIGIKKNITSKLFDIDFKYIKKGTNDESGAGIGLKLCKEFAMKNKGKIWVESIPNKGTTFTFSLPIRNDQ